MYCKNCGAEIKQNKKFCPKCGTPVSFPTPEAPKRNVAPEPQWQVQNEGPAEPKRNVAPEREWQDKTKGPAEVVREEPPKTPRKRKIKKRWIAVFVIALVILLAGGVGTVCLTSPAAQVVTAINDGQYDSAVELYNEEVTENVVWRLLASPMLSSVVDSTMDQYEKGDLTYQEANSRLSAISSFDNEELASAARSYLTKLMTLEDSQTAFSEAEDLYNEGKYMDASELYAKVSEDSPNYEEAQSKLDKCHELYVNEVLEKSSDPKSQSDYQSYLSMLNVAVDVFPEDEKLLQRQAKLENGYQALVKSSAMTEASDAVAAENYETAITVLDAALKVLPEDDELTKMRTSAQSSYEKSITDQVNALVESGDYAGALSLLAEAKKFLPDSTAISQLYVTTEESQPVALSSLKLSESGGDYELVTNQVVTMDTIGNTYSPGNLFRFGTDWSSTEGYVKYYLGGKYTTLRFTLAVSDEREGHQNPSELTIYGNDNQILYTSGGLTRTTVPQDVKVDVTGVEWLYIRSSSDWYSVGLLVADPMLYK